METSLQAVILAGGRGTRLSPLTDDTPKPLMKVLGKTVLEHVLEKAAASGAAHAVVTTGYLPWRIEAGAKKSGNMAVSYHREASPRGTAGAVKDAYDGKSGAVLVLCGDGIVTFDLAAAVAFHHEKHADVTVVAHESANPLAYGVITTDADGRVRGFTEKPPWSRVTSGLVNTGIYVLDPAVLANVPADKPYDFARELFPKLMRDGGKLYAYRAAGDWLDIGSLEEYENAVRAALDGKIPGFAEGAYTEEELAAKEIRVETPVYVARTALLGRDVKLGPYTVIGENAVVSDGCDVVRSVVGDGTTLGAGCGVYGTLFGRKCRLGGNCVTGEGSAVGGGTVIDSGVILPKYAYLPAGTRVTAEDAAARQTPGRQKTLFDEDGLPLDPTGVSPAYLVRIGSAAAGACFAEGAKQPRIGLMHDALPVSERMARTVMAGVAASGAEGYLLSDGYESMARFAASALRLDAALYFSASDEGGVRLKFFDEYGLAVTSAWEKAFERAFYSAEEYAAPDAFHAPREISSLRMLYEGALLRFLDSFGRGCLAGARASFPQDGEIAPGSPAYTAIRLFTLAGGRAVQSATAPAFHFSDDGRQVWMTQNGVTADTAHVVAAILAEETDGGVPVPIGETDPALYRRFCEKNGVPTVVYAADSARDGLTPEAFLRHFYLLDGVYGAFALSALAAKMQSTPEALIRRLPPFGVKTAVVGGSPDRAGVMRKLSALSGGAQTEREGVKLVMAHGSVTVIPGRISGFKIISEGVNAEAAEELCDRAGELVQ